jgi:hypothetical protein
LVDLQTKRFWFDEYIVERIKSNGVCLYKKLDIWNKFFLKEHNLKDPRSVCMKLIHFYLKKTEKHASNNLIKLTDKILKNTGL